jgi:uncharacterized pyridoxal phosphate-dependent enzyme
MSYFKQYGFKEIINADRRVTALGGSAINSVVAKALHDAAMEYVDIAELMAETGKAIAMVTGAEDGCPTTGAAAGIVISTAAVIAGTNLSFIERIPNTDGLRNEIIIQKGHSAHFGASIKQMIGIGGGKAIEVGHANYVEKQHIAEAVSENTAALFYVKSRHAAQKGMQSLETMLSIAHDRGIPLIIDAAADEDLRKYIALGVDLVIYSGGKAIEGPTSGLICGRQPLIEACRAQYKGVGRPMKVGKEAMAGLIVALRRYGQRPDESQKQFERMQWLARQFQDVPGVQCTVVQDEEGTAAYQAQLTFDQKVAGLSGNEIIQRLKSGTPAIYTRYHSANHGTIIIDPRPLLEGQEQINADRIKEVLSGN